mmetsp:Transcript_523/g.1265  ORF Transcript_523/g.1265 Transcript_523/m.1265 type:complete len:219 (-) Transcript_523:317-973(-)
MCRPPLPPAGPSASQRRQSWQSPPSPGAQGQPPGSAGGAAASLPGLPTPPRRATRWRRGPGARGPLRLGLPRATGGCHGRPHPHQRHHHCPRRPRRPLLRGSRRRERRPRCPCRPRTPLPAPRCSAPAPRRPLRPRRPSRRPPFPAPTPRRASPPHPAPRHAQDRRHPSRRLGSRTREWRVTLSPCSAHDGRRPYSPWLWGATRGKMAGPTARGPASG